MRKKTDTRAYSRGVVQTDLANICAHAHDLPAIERQGIADAITILKTGTLKQQEHACKVLQKAVISRSRVAKKQAFDRQKRVLVGARVNRPFADKCRACAFAEGLSLNQWVRQSLMRSIETCAGRVWDANACKCMQVDANAYEGVFLHAPHRG